MTDPDTLPEDPSIGEKLNRLFKPWNRTDAPGLVVGVSLQGASIYRRGFGMASLETAVANTPATRMRLGSTSKHFTCLMALLLMEDGKLDIDRPVRTYIPELVGPAGTPTLRQLMQHVGGSRCHLDLGFIGRGMAAPEVGAGLEAMVAQTGVNFAPGEAMIYNNGGYHLVSIAIERAGGAPFEQQLKTRIFDPLSMTDTASIPSDHDITPGVATLHVPRPGGGWRRGLFPSDELKGEGGMVSTIDDMIRWMSHLRTRDRVGVAASWTAMATPPVHPDGVVGMYGLGLMFETYRGLKTVHHAGGAVGGTCQMLTLPEEGLDVIVMANGAPAANVVRLAEQVVDIVLADRVGPEDPKVMAESHKALKGPWRSSESGVVYNLVEEEGQLKLAFGLGQVGLPMAPTDNGDFVVPAASLSEIRLTPSGEGFDIRFGGKTAHYTRAAAGEGDLDAFVAAAQGRYVCAETAATATIARDGETVSLKLSDGYGRANLGLTVLGNDLAAPTSGGVLALFGAAVKLINTQGRATGFSINTMRTRDLVFERA